MSTYESNRIVALALIPAFSLLIVIVVSRSNAVRPHSDLRECEIAQLPSPDCFAEPRPLSLA